MLKQINEAFSFSSSLDLHYSLLPHHGTNCFFHTVQNVFHLSEQFWTVLWLRSKTLNIILDQLSQED